MNQTLRFVFQPQVSCVEIHSANIMAELSPIVIYSISTQKTSRSNFKKAFKDFLEETTSILKQSRIEMRQKYPTLLR